MTSSGFSSAKSRSTRRSKFMLRRCRNSFETKSWRRATGSNSSQMYPFVYSYQKEAYHSLLKISRQYPAHSFVMEWPGPKHS